MSNRFDDIQFLKNPLLTDEGFVNDACLNELSSVLENMPEPYERLKHDPEWSNPIYVFDSSIVGAFADSAIRQFGSVPPNLEAVLNYIFECFRKDVFSNDKEDVVISDDIPGRMAPLSLCDINRRLFSYLQSLDIFNDWNDSSKCDNWIDLSALLRNTCVTLRDEERRHNNEISVFESEEDIN